MTSDCVTGSPLSRHLWVPTECAVAGLAGRDMTRRRCYSSSVFSGERRFCPRNEATLLVLAEPGPGGQGQGRPCLLPRPPAPRFLLCRTNWHEGFLFCLGSGGLKARGEPRGQLPFPSSRGALGNVTAGSQRSPWGGGRTALARLAGRQPAPAADLSSGPSAPHSAHSRPAVLKFKKEVGKSHAAGAEASELADSVGRPPALPAGPAPAPFPLQGHRRPTPTGRGAGGSEHRARLDETHQAHAQNRSPHITLKPTASTFCHPYLSERN